MRRACSSIGSAIGPRNRVAWSPAQIPEVLAGYWWDAANASGLGTAAFKVPEGNGNTSFDLIQATVATQPTALTENNGSQFRMRKSVDANPSIIATSGSVSAGWTGNTYLAMWVRLPDASGDVTGVGNLFAHQPSTAGQRRLIVSLAISSGDRITSSVSNDGTATVVNQWATPFVGGAWHWLEFLITPGTSYAMYSDLVLVTPAVSATPGTPLFNGSAPISVCCRSLVPSANVDTTDWATVYYCNGIPRDAHREALRAYHAPLAITGYP